MPMLKNGKREAFAQALARGESQSAAYRVAYGKDNPPQACKIAKDEAIRARVAEIQQKVEAIVIQAHAAPLAKHEISKERVLAELAKMAFAEIRAIPVDEHGNPIPESFDDLIGPETKRKALVDLAKVAGYIVEKRETAKVGSFEDKTDDELRAILTGGASALGRRRQGAGSPGDQAADEPAKGRPH